MSLLTGPRIVNVMDGGIRNCSLPLKNNATAWKGGACGYDTASAGGIVNMNTGSTTLIPIGVFLGGSGQNTSGGTVLVPVYLNREVNLTYWDSVTGGGAITIANLFALVYWADDHTLTTVATTASPAGRVWSVGGMFGSGLGYPGAIGIEMPFSG